MGEGWVAWPGPGARRLHAPVHRPQPDAPGRVRDRGPDRHPRRHRVSDPHGRRRPSTRSPRRPACGRSSARRRGPRSTSSPLRGRPLRARRRLDRDPDDLAGGRGVDAAGARASGELPADVRRVSDDEPEPEAARGRDPARARPRARRRGRRRPCPLGRRGRVADRRRCAGPRRGDHRTAAAAGAARAAATRTPGSRSACCSTSRRGGRPDGRVLPVRGPRLLARGGQGAGSTTSSAACSRSASARASTSAC